MNEKDDLTLQEAIKLAYIRTWATSLVCGLLILFAAAAATRIPLYVATSDHLRLTGVILFGLLALAGLISTAHAFICLGRLTAEPPRVGDNDVQSGADTGIGSGSHEGLKAVSLAWRCYSMSQTFSGPIGYHTFPSGWHPANTWWLHLGQTAADGPEDL